MYMNMFSRTLGATLGAAVMCATALAAPIKVPEDYPSIQAAVSAAPAGALILIGPGVYNESVLITTPGLRLIGREGLGTVIIDGTGLDANGIHIQGADGVTIKKLVVENFDEYVGPGVVDFRIGILVEDSNNCSIVSNIGRHNGDGLVLRNSDHCHFVGNSGRNNIHNGIFVRNDSDENFLADNEAIDNGPDANPAPDFVPPGVGCGIQLSLESDDNFIVDNLLTGNGRGLQFDRGSTANVARNNECPSNLRFGISALAVGGQPAATGNTIQDNVSLSNDEFDLFDAGFPPAVGNVWQNNVFDTSNF